MPSKPVDSDDFIRHISQLQTRISKLERYLNQSGGLPIDLTSDVVGDLPVADGGTGASTAAAARTNLGLGFSGMHVTPSVNKSITSGSWITTTFGATPDYDTDSYKTTSTEFTIPETAKYLIVFTGALSQSNGRFYLRIYQATGAVTWMQTSIHPTNAGSDFCQCILVNEIPVSTVLRCDVFQDGGATEALVATQTSLSITKISF